jgi:hypothetical protein
MNFRSLLAATIVTLGLPCLSGAEDTVLRMKTGDVKLTILDPDGIRPLANVEVKVQDAREATRLIQTATDKSGSCAMTLEQGTYGLSIDGKAVALIESASDAETSHLRLVTPRKPLRIGGAEGAPAGVTNVVESVAAGVSNATPAQVVAEEEARRRGLFYWVGNNGLKTALIIGGAVATGVIIENNNDDGSSPTAPPATPPATPPRRSRPSTPDIDPPVSN